MLITRLSVIASACRGGGVEDDLRDGSPDREHDISVVDDTNFKRPAARVTDITETCA
jgi:hypothetical protein